MTRKNSSSVSLYVDATDFHQFVAALQAEHTVVTDAKVSEIHEAIFKIAQEHEEEVVSYIRDNAR